MSIQHLLEDVCSITHIRRVDASPGYGLPEAPTYGYADEPDETGVPCHFCCVYTNAVVVREPAAMMEARVKLILPSGTDVRLNDRITDVHGRTYTAELPRNVRWCHTAVWLRRSNAERAL